MRIDNTKFWYLKFHALLQSSLKRYLLTEDYRKAWNFKYQNWVFSFLTYVILYIDIYIYYIYIYMPIITWYTNLVWQKKLHSYVTMIHSNSKISIQSLNLGKSKTLIILLFFINFMLLYYFNASLFHFSLLNS